MGHFSNLSTSIGDTVQVIDDDVIWIGKLICVYAIESEIEFIADLQGSSFSFNIKTGVRREFITLPSPYYPKDIPIVANHKIFLPANKKQQL